MSGRSFLAPRATASIPVPRSPNAGRRRDHQLSGGRKSAPDSPDRRCPAAASSCLDRKSTRLNSSHLGISYAVFCLKKKKELNGCASLPKREPCRTAAASNTYGPSAEPWPHGASRVPQGTTILDRQKLPHPQHHHS